MRHVSPREAHALMQEQGYVYLDVRSVPEFDLGHPEGAYNVPWAQPSADGMLGNIHFVDEVKVLWTHDTKLILGCQTGRRSELAGQALSAVGFRDVVVQRAGMDGVRDAFGRIREPGWTASALPLQVETAPGHSHAYISARARPRGI